MDFFKFSHIVHLYFSKSWLNFDWPNSRNFKLLTVKLRYHKNFPFGFLLQSTITTAVNKHLLFFSLLFPPDGSWLNISFQCNFKFQNVNTTIAYLKATLTFMGPLSWWRSVLYECNCLVYFLISLHITNVLIRSKALHLLPFLSPLSLIALLVQVIVRWTGATGRL